jgi:YD repeat-containing protein
LPSAPYTTATSEFDRAGQLIAQVDAVGRRTTYGYDEAGNQTSTTDPLGNVSSTTFDKLGRVLTEREPKSISPKDAQYGDDQYLTDIAPGTKTCAQLSHCFLGIPYQGRKFTHYGEIEVSGLNIVKGRDGVFVNPSGTPLNITQRLVSAGVN